MSGLSFTHSAYSTTGRRTNEEPLCSCYKQGVLWIVYSTRYRKLICETIQYSLHFQVRHEGLGANKWIDRRYLKGPTRKPPGSYYIWKSKTRVYRVHFISLQEETVFPNKIQYTPVQREMRGSNKGTCATLTSHNALRSANKIAYFPHSSLWLHSEAFHFLFIYPVVRLDALKAFFFWTVSQSFFCCCFNLVIPSHAHFD